MSNNLSKRVKVCVQARTNGTPKGGMTVVLDGLDRAVMNFDTRSKSFNTYCSIRKVSATKSNNAFGNARITSYAQGPNDAMKIYVKKLTINTF